MGSRSATELLQLPVRLHGIRLGRPVDLLLAPLEWRALGFVVLCRDDSSRFLVFAAADLLEDGIDVSSALLLLEDVEFYRDRSRSLRDLLGNELRDLLVRPDGRVEALVVERDGVVQQIEPNRVPVEPERVSTA
jgi:hypothetical protein